MSEKRKRLAEKKKKKKKPVSAPLVAAPSRHALQHLMRNYQAGHFSKAEQLAAAVLHDFPEHPFTWKIIGVVQRNLGKLDDSLYSLRRAVNLAPDDAEAHNNLGVTLRQIGELRSAMSSLERASVLKPEQAEIHNNLANVQRILGELKSAEASCNRAISLKPDLSEAHNCLGNVLKEKGDFDGAEACYRRAIALRSDYYEAHNNLGAVLQVLGRLDEAEASSRKAITLRPNIAEAHYNLGVTLQDQGDYQGAEASYRNALDLKADYAEAYNNLGVTLAVCGKFDESEASYRQAISLRPNFASAHNNLGNALKDLGRLAEAEKSYRRAIGIEPNYANAHSNLAITLKKIGRFEEAIKTCRMALALEPERPEAHFNLAITLQDVGRFDEARASCSQAISLRPDFAEAHRHWATMKTFTSCDTQFKQLQRLVEDHDLSDEQRCHIYFALAKAYEDLADFGAAFQCYSKGNALRRTQLSYDKEREIDLFARLRNKYFSFASTVLSKRSSNDYPTPIFIIGMPRSGTSLIEQIVSSHSQVTGAGELPYAFRFGSEIASGKSNTSEEALLNFREQYLSSLKIISKGKGFVTDKMPLNYQLLGLICVAIPEAKVIHVRRDPAAVCWANYKQYFANDLLKYCYDLEDIVHYYALYEDLMDHWAARFSNKIYELDYELLTTNQKDETKRLCTYLNLGWENHLLYPERNLRGVTTASSVQVRQPIYQGSSEQWKRYQPFIKGLFDHFYDAKP